jgi:pilus assembly protein CpaE
VILIAHSQILVVGPDARLRDECKAAFAATSDSPPVLHYAADFSRAVEEARTRRPSLAIGEMAPDLRQMRTFAEELNTASPETKLIGAFKPEIFGHQLSESAVLIDALRSGVSDFLRRPVSATDLGQLLDRLSRQGAVRSSRLGKVVSFLSNKGGVGKSTLLVNTAVGLARAGHRVLLLDTSLQMGVCAAMLDMQPQLTLVDAAREHARLDETLLEHFAVMHDSGLQLLAAPADAVEGSEVTEETVSRVLSLARRSYDYVIVDTFPMFDRVIMAVLDQTDLAYVVIENVVPTLLGAEKFLKLLDSVGFPVAKQRLVINRYTSRSNLPPSDAAERLERDIDLIVPFDHRLYKAANLGKPFSATTHRFSQTARRLRQLVDHVRAYQPRASIEAKPETDVAAIPLTDRPLKRAGHG